MKILPTTPAPSAVTPSLVDFGNTLTPALGGSEQRINRLGNRFRLSVTMPPMQNKEQGMKFVNRLVRGRSEGLRMKFPLSGFNPGTPGSPAVDGANHAGRLLDVAGFTPGYQIKEGQFFSIETDGQHYLYMIDADNSSSTGAPYGANLVINPMLRIPPSDGDICHFAQPMIEGLIEGSETQWNYALDYNVGIEFTIKERR